MTAEDQLVRRLERMTMPPAARDLAARAVAVAREPVRPRRRRWGGLAIVAAALVLAGSAMAATWPAPLRTLGAVPALGPFARQAMRALGATERPPARQESVTASGYTLHVASAYDDGNRVILVLHIDRAGAASQGVYAYTAAPNDRDGTAAIGRWPTLTGADGQPLLPTLSLGDGREVFLFYSRPAHGPAAGTPLTLSADRVMVSGGPLALAVPGRWTLHFQAAPSRAPQDLRVPAAGSAGPIQVSVTAVRVSDAYLDVRFDATGPGDQVDYVDATLIAPDGTMARLIDQGRPQPQKGAAPDPAVRTNHDDFAWQLAGAGGYRLVFRSPDGNQLVREIAVPHGRAASVPGLDRALCCG
jgi:hypothetical protein